MLPDNRAPFRIFTGGSSDDTGLPEPHVLASRELFRPVQTRVARRDLEPYSRSWFEELEIKRYAPHGAWLRRALEFSRHPGETLLMMGPGVGSDALQYHRHGVQVTICTTSADFPEVVRKNFEIRGLTVRIVQSIGDESIPYDKWSFDLAYWNALHDPPADPAARIQELYRVLKPGGKLFALFPARYNASFWQNVLIPFRRWYCSPAALTDAPAYSGRRLRRLFSAFCDHRISQRQLRRSELPYLWRFFPLTLLERLMGHVLILRAFKPVSAALEALPVEAAA